MGTYSDDVLKKVQEYYVKSRISISGQDSQMVIFVHDAFEGAKYWNSADDTFLYPNDPANRQNPSIIFDTHHYQVFTDKEIQQHPFQHLKEACAQTEILKQYPAAGAIVGEFSTAVTDCAKWLNGRGTGSRYAGTFKGDHTPPTGNCDVLSGDASNFPDDYKRFLGAYWRAQTEAYEAGGLGWIQWTWKTEHGQAEDWSYEAGLQYGWIPHGFDHNQQQKGICEQVQHHHRHNPPP